jgi:hypothetical protein
LLELVDTCSADVVPQISRPVRRLQSKRPPARRPARASAARRV